MQKAYVWVSGKEKIAEFYGQRAEVVFKIYNPKVYQNTKIIKGLVVSKGSGHIEGRVKIITNPFTDGKKTKQGDILVSIATTPDIVSAMRKAGAIVTNVGDITSHAAIVSR
ncbi:hypothetical protein COV04_00365 [Candidatus Uhrbacteria bacterium CG10_big_fil_rev_8_21_14_0_10_48_11]|uniref:PEP-utilising enzyme mobile domain-containing protein n=1 Tax=Candidatus Uhrbacteria bacterium CG10_big_fil_rev_8_21_14_0_10_48_11 TaxID=1975037 RepID=A0A2M8LFW3_9BACT|nr:MAG: hypothetical protein COV04_00365 [Candidatus Uhrbacteria bacterium CG10_big_fil_rev_8_21_14_0_10_48_11]